MIIMFCVICLQQVAKVIWQRPRIKTYSAWRWEPRYLLCFLAPEHYVDPFSRFAQPFTQQMTDNETDRQTPGSSIAIVRISRIRCGLKTWTLFYTVCESFQWTSGLSGKPTWGGGVCYRDCGQTASDGGSRWKNDIWCLLPLLSALNIHLLRLWGTTQTLR